MRAGRIDEWRLFDREFDRFGEDNDALGKSHGIGP